MIGQLRGALLEKEDNSLTIDVSGVGYLVFVSQMTLHTLPPLGEAIALFIKTEMREDAITLFGFQSKAEKEWFCLLKKVQGVGPKVALAILSTLSPAQLMQALQTRDINNLCRVPGIGKKVAERLVTELKNKLPTFAASTIAEESAPCLQANHHIYDAKSALIHLGYKESAVESAIAAIVNNSDKTALLDSEKLIRLGLKQLSR